MNKIDFEKMKNITPRMIGEKLAPVWHRFYKLLLVIFFLIMTAIGAYLWYSSLYQSGWDELEKSNFIKSKFQESNLKKDALQRVIQRINSSQEKFNQEVFPGRDIFKPY